MHEETLTNRILLFIAKQLGLDLQDVAVEAHFDDDLGIDYLDVMELTILIEEHFAQGRATNDDDQMRLVESRLSR